MVLRRIRAADTAVSAAFCVVVPALVFALGFNLNSALQLKLTSPFTCSTVLGPTVFRGAQPPSLRRERAAGAAASAAFPLAHFKACTIMLS